MREHINFSSLHKVPTFFITFLFFILPTAIPYFQIPPLQMDYFSLPLNPYKTQPATTYFPTPTQTPNPTHVDPDLPHLERCPRLPTPSSTPPPTPTPPSTTTLATPSPSPSFFHLTHPSLSSCGPSAPPSQTTTTTTAATRTKTQATTACCGPETRPSPPSQPPPSPQQQQHRPPLRQARRRSKSLRSTVHAKLETWKKNMHRILKR